MTELSQPWITVDVIGLQRVQRMHQDFGSTFERHLLHPQEQDRLDSAAYTESARLLAGSLATKEAWVKARSGRPPGWKFAHTAFEPTVRTDVPATVTAVLGSFVRDLGVGSVEVGRLHCDASDRPGDRSPEGPGDRWAWFGVLGPWLISGVLA